jgi:plastocyanin
MPFVLTSRRIATVATVFLLAACGGDTAKPSDGAPTPATPTPSAAGTVKPTGRLITIEMNSDDKGNYFKPSEIEAKQGDMLHFVLTTGVHNVNFLADSNPGVSGLPAPTAFAQLPGQVTDILVTMEPGKTYYFQCDPHAALGMKGHLKVEP